MNGVSRLAAAILVLAGPVGARSAAEGEAFRPPSGEGASRLTRLSAEESGLETASLYRDPRAWGERLKPATIGTVGTGVGVGDFDGDGFPDLFVAMREGRNRLYLNDGGRRFVDRTLEAGILESPDWSAGMTVADVNGDGRPDIYVCFFDAPNRLYLNRGDAVFEEVAAQLGLDVKDASSGAFFADYDKDGDLDLYLQTNERYGRMGEGRPDYFLRNDGEGGFVDVTAEVGIRHGEEGVTRGHSVLWIDYDGDGWEDLYVANDFRERDFLYLNHGDGTFRFAPERVPVAPYSSMGADVGDVTGDGRLDLLTTDMATPSYVKHVESMLTSGTKTRELAADALPVQVMKNGLLLNRGRGDYVDVAYAWNLAATDWTWAPRLADLDNDGWADALFTNGMIRQFHNADLALAQDRQATVAAKNAIFQRSPVLREANLAFRNRGGRGFEAANERWGFEDVGVSFGAAFLDFDRDGDLDLVYTNYEAPPTLWRNDLGRGNAVQVKLVGRASNRDAVGAVAVAHFGGRRQGQKILANRGYLGSDEKVLHFGLGEADRIELLEIWWPEGGRQEARDLRAGRRYVVERSEKLAEPRELGPEPAAARFRLLGEEESGAAGRRGRGDGRGLLYPLKAIPGSPQPRMLRADFDGDGKDDVMILREWQAPRLLLTGGGSLADASEAWGVAELAGLWELARVEDFNGDGRPDVFLGGMGINNEISYRAAGEGEGRFLRLEGRFSPQGPLVNLNAYQWGGQLRMYDGLRDFSEIDARVPRLIGSFRETGEMTIDAFMERVDFEVEERFEIERFRSGILLNEGGGFRFRPLPLEGQYGRVWDAAVADAQGDGLSDLILLLGQVSPHARSRQREGSFVYVLFGDGKGDFEADERPPLEVLPEELMMGLELAETDEGVELRVALEDGRVARYGLGDGAGAP